MKYLAALVLVLTGAASVVQADLIILGGLTDFLPGEDPNSPADVAAALNRQYHTGLVRFLAEYTRDPSSGAITFVPGAITDTSRLSLMRLDPYSAKLSWDLTGAGFQNRFVVGQIRGSDFDGPFEVFRVTPDEFVNSFGAQPPRGIPGPPFYFFGKPVGAPEPGSTISLLLSGVAILGIARALLAK